MDFALLFNQRHDTDAVPSREKPSVLIGEKAGCTPQSVWTRLRSENSPRRTEMHFRCPSHNPTAQTKRTKTFNSLSVLKISTRQHNCLLMLLSDSFTCTTWQVPVTMGRRVLRVRMVEQPPIEGSCEYLEYAVADSRQDVVL